MGSSLSAQILTVSITESITLMGYDQGASTSFTVASIKNVYKRIITVPAGTDTTIAQFRANPSNAIDLDTCKYVRVTNLDDTNAVNLSLQISADEDGAADHSATFLLDPQKSFMLGTVHDGIAVDDDATTVITTLVDLESIIVDSSSNAVDIEVFAAST